MQNRNIKWPRYLVSTVLCCVTVWGIYMMVQLVDEVILTLGEPYEQVLEHSHSTLPPIERGIAWGGHVSRPAQFRFADIRYGFVTPAAKFLNVGYDKEGNVWSVTLSPQVKTLSLNATMAILVDLQNQLRRGGWRLIRPDENPAITDTPAMRAQIRARADPITYWVAADKYQLILNVRRFVHESHPEDERYLITLQLSTPFVGGGPKYSQTQIN